VKTQTLLIIISGCLAIIAIAGLFINGIASERGNEKGVKLGKILGESMLIICSYIVFVSLNNTEKRFSVGFDTKRRFSEMHNLTQLDSTMLYMTGTTRRTYYLFWSKDSILHHSKEIEYDITDV